MQLCGEFAKPKLGCLKDFECKIEFKAESKPTLMHTELISRREQPNSNVFGPHREPQC